MRGAAGAGAIVQWGFLDPGFSIDAGRQAIAEIKANQKFWYGDFYPLTPCTNARDQFMAWQLHRPDLGAGIVLAFRRPECPYAGLIIGLHAVKPDAAYSVEFVDESRKSTTRTISGRELADGLPLKVTGRPASLLVRYREVPAEPQ